MGVLEICDSDSALGSGWVLKNSVQDPGSTGVSEAKCQPDVVLSICILSGLFSLNLCVCVCVYGWHVCRHPQRGEDNVGSPREVSRGVYDLPAGNQISVLTH